MRLCLGEENSKESQPAWASVDDIDRRRAAGVHDEHAAAGLDAVIARMRRMRQRRAARFVVGEQRQQLIGRRRPHAVEMRERPVGMAEEAQHRHHAVDGVEERLRRRDIARCEQLAQRQELEQQLDHGAGIAADMAAVGKDLPLDLPAQTLGGGFDVARLPGDAERRVGERDGRLHAPDAAMGVADGVAQIAHLAHQAAQEAPVEPHIGVLQHQGRLAEPGDDAPRQYVGPPCQRVPRALQRDPFVDQRAPIGAGDAGLGGTQMAQPVETEQRRRPFLRRRLHLEHRAAVADDDFAGEGEAAGIDFVGEGRIGGAQVLRRDQEPVVLEPAKRQGQQRVAVEASGQPAHRTAQREPGQPCMVRD